MTDAGDGLPYASIGVPGRDMGLKLLLDKDADGTGSLVAIPYKVTGIAADGEPIDDPYPPVDLHRGDVKVSQDLDLSIGLTDFGEFTLLIAKRDPGQGLVWIAFALLIAGITITFYRPRRRVWTRIAPDGRLGIVWRSDRYVDVEREFGRLLDQLVAARRPGTDAADGRTPGPGTTGRRPALNRNLRLVRGNLLGAEPQPRSAGRLIATFAHAVSVRPCTTSYEPAGDP